MIHISTDKEKIDINMVYQYLSKESYWAKGIPLPRLQKAIENSLCFSVFKNEIQIGFARVITDQATFFYLCDVFIIENERKNGYSKILMDYIMRDPALQNLRRYMLATADAHGLYAQFGFTALKEPERIMEIKNVNVYQ